MAHTGFDPLTVHAVSWSALLRLQGALQGRCPKWMLRFVPLPGPSSLGSQILGRRTVPSGPRVLLTFRVPTPRFPGALWERRPRCAVCLLWGAGLRLRPCVLLTFRVPAPWFPGALRERRLRCTMCLLWGAGLRLRPSWWMSTIQEPEDLVSNWEPAHSLVEDAGLCR